MNKYYGFMHAATRELPTIFQFGFACLALTTLTATLSHKSRYDDTVQDYDEQTAYNLANDYMMRKPESAMYSIVASTLAIAGLVFVAKVGTLMYLHTRNIINLSQPKTPQQRIQQGLANHPVVTHYYTADPDRDNTLLSGIRMLESVFSPDHEVAKYIQLTARVFLATLVIQNIKQDYNNYENFDTYANEEYKYLVDQNACTVILPEQTGYEETLKELCDAKSFYVAAQKAYGDYVKNSAQTGKFFLEASLVILGSITFIDCLFRYWGKYTDNAGRSCLLDGILAVTKNLMPFLLLAMISHAYFTDFTVAMTDTVSEYKDIYDDFYKYALNALENPEPEDYAKGYAYQWFLGTVNGSQLKNAIAFSTLFLAAAGINFLYEIIKTISLARVGAIKLSKTHPSEETQAQLILSASDSADTAILTGAEKEPLFIGPYFNKGNRLAEIHNTVNYQIFRKIHAFFHDYFTEDFLVSIADFIVLAEVFITFMIASQLIIFAFSHEDMQCEYRENYNDYWNSLMNCDLSHEKETACDSSSAYKGTAYAIYDWIDKLDDRTATFLLTVPFVAGGLSLVLAPCVASFFPNRNNNNGVAPQEQPLMEL
ncbi:MAG: hypothetical protein LRY43_04935 [Gammaproteobacteria bacterium]|nr:hypothetical protein [Gammaproteobacteria bacterium]